MLHFDIFLVFFWQNACHLLKHTVFFNTYALKCCKTQTCLHIFVVFFLSLSFNFNLYQGYIWKHRCISYTKKLSIFNDFLCFFFVTHLCFQDFSIILHRAKIHPRKSSKSGRTSTDDPKKSTFNITC